MVAKKPLTAERIRTLVGDLSDSKVLEILKLRPTEKDLLEARILQSEGERPRHGVGPQSGVAVRIYEILAADTEEDEEKL